MQYKSIDIKEKVITIKLEKYGEFRGKRQVEQAKALCCLAGGYNTLGKKIDLKKYNELVSQLDKILYETVELMNDSKE